MGSLRATLHCILSVCQLWHSPGPDQTPTVNESVQAALYPHTLTYLLLHIWTPAEDPVFWLLCESSPPRSQDGRLSLCWFFGHSAQCPLLYLSSELRAQRTAETMSGADSSPSHCPLGSGHRLPPPLCPYRGSPSPPSMVLPLTRDDLGPEVSSEFMELQPESYCVNTGKA